MYVINKCMDYDKLRLYSMELFVIVIRSPVGSGVHGLFSLLVLLFFVFWLSSLLMSPSPSPLPPMWDHWHQTSLLIWVVGEQDPSPPYSPVPDLCALLSHFTGSLHDARREIHTGGHVWAHRLDICHTYRIAFWYAFLEDYSTEWSDILPESDALQKLIHCDTINNTHNQHVILGYYHYNHLVHMNTL